MAFIETSGFEVETILDYQEVRLTEVQANHYFTPKPFGCKPTHQLKTKSGKMGQCEYLVDSDGMYTERLVSPVIDYKITKKEQGFKNE